MFGFEIRQTGNVYLVNEVSYNAFCLNAVIGYHSTFVDLENVNWHAMYWLESNSHWLSVDSILSSRGFQI